MSHKYDFLKTTLILILKFYLMKFQFFYFFKETTKINVLLEKSNVQNLNQLVFYPNLIMKIIKCLLKLVSLMFITITITAIITYKIIPLF